jgi:hypothetical protein
LKPIIVIFLEKYKKNGKIKEKEEGGISEKVEEIEALEVAKKRGRREEGDGEEGEGD